MRKARRSKTLACFFIMVGRSNPLPYNLYLPKGAYQIGSPILYGVGISASQRWI